MEYTCDNLPRENSNNIELTQKEWADKFIFKNKDKNEPTSNKTTQKKPKKSHSPIYKAAMESI